jgi:predicted permease
MLHDLRFALRQLLKAPAFTIAAVIVLALGIGANTAVFSLVHALIFKPRGFPQADEVVQLYSQNKKDPESFRLFSYPAYRDIVEQNTVFSGVLAHSMAMVGVGEKGNTRRTMAGVVSANYFNVLGAPPLLGRAFLPEEETPGRTVRVAVVSHNYWKKHGARVDLVGSEMLINGKPFTIVGVAPEGFTGTTHLIGSEVWVPLSVHHEMMNDFQRDDARSGIGERTSRELFLVARLKPGLTTESADPALKTLAANLEQAYPVEQKDQTFVARPLPRFATSNNPQGDDEVSTLGMLLLGMAAVVLLVACLNLANMLLARGTARRKEIAIRLALGARRGRIVRQLLTEGFVLALLGGACGVLLALWSTDLLIASLTRLLPFDFVWMSGPSAALLLATFAFCLAGTLAFGLGPALKLSRAGAIDDLKEHAGEDAVRRRWRFLPRNPLVVVQFAFSLALVTAAALFIRGASTAANVDTGLETDRVFLVELDASLGGFDATRARELYRTLEERLNALPEVESASLSGTIPFGDTELGKSVRRAGLTPAPDTKPATAAEGRAFGATFRSVGADYFRTVGLPLLRGRSFTHAEATQSGGPAVALIDEVLAKKLWPEGDALGQQVQFAGDDMPKPVPTQNDANSGDIRPGEPVEIIGIVPATRHQLFEKNVGSAIYVPFARGFQSSAFFFAKFRTLPGGTEEGAADLLRRALHEVSPTLPVLTIRTFEQHFESNIQLWAVRAGAAIFTVFGVLALGLAAVGLYGVKAYSVARRTREIGIRMALGAERGAVLRMILREGSAMLAAGLVLGLLLAMAAGKLLSSILYGVSSLDPVAFTVAPIVLAIAGLIATWLPARRATRISPMDALRAE